MKSNQLIRINFKHVSIEIVCNDEVSWHTSDLLFSDLQHPAVEQPQLIKRFRLVHAGESDWSLLDNEREYCRHASRYQAAYCLMNEVIFHCINTNSHQHAIHAGAVCRDNKFILIPGSSGRGKSTLTAWLCREGCSYLTDELVFLGEGGSIEPFVRPVNLKTRQPLISERFIEENQDQV